MSSQEYYDSLRLIGEYLIENKAKTDYVLNCFYQQENIDIEEMNKAEGSFTDAQKFELRMLSKREQVETIKSELSNFKNEKFKSKVAEFIQWINFILDPPKIFVQKFPSDLKTYLSSVKRYENDVIVMAEDINRKFKHMSLSRGMPAP